MPFRHKEGDTFRLAISFSYDVTAVAFKLVIFDKSGAQVKEYLNNEWVLDGTRKKVLTKTPVEFNLAKGEYKLKLTHTYSNGVVRTRFDSQLTVY